MYKKITTFIFFIFITSQHYAQTFYVNGADVTINEKAYLEINGSSVNNGILTNSGKIALKGNWTNNNQYQTNAGIFVLNGKTEQTIRHNAQLFDTLVIAEGSNKLFLENATISGSLVLNNGLITPDNSVFLVTEKATIRGGSNNAYVNGLLYFAGTESRTFPVGKDKQYLPVSVSYFEGDALIGIEAFTDYVDIQTEEGIDNIIENRFWKISKLSGENYQAQLTLPVPSGLPIETIERLIVIQGSELNDIFTSIGGIEQNAETLKSELKADKYVWAIATFLNIETTEVYIPDFLSPYAANDDDKHLKIYGNTLLNDDFTFTVYNKWGNIIFRTNSLEEMQTVGWNGTNYETGNPASPGNYVYALKGKTLNGKTIQKSGTIGLIK